MARKSERGRERVAVFDGDDTLWDTQELYDAAKREFFDLLGALGHEPDAVAAKFAEIDVAKVHQLGFSRRRFPISMRETYEFFCTMIGEEGRPEVAGRVTAIAEAVFQQTPTVRPDTREALAVLDPYYFLVLFTAGDEEIQWARVRQSGLERHFDRVRVVPQKSEEAWASLLSAEAICGAAAWSVGNSVRSDINPALKLGLRCVLVPGGGWEFERATVAGGNVWYAASLREAATVILREDSLRNPLVADDVARAR